MLIDTVTITIEAGKGGNGRVSFLRNAQTARGGPDGGNGGNGGNIFLQGVNDSSALQRFQYQKEIRAEEGIAGGKQKQFGRNGKDTTIYLPIGTFVTDTTTHEQFEITNDTDKILIAHGGVGGKGNDEFKSATNQTPRYAEKGTPGEKKELFLELKLIADIGFIGLPNAGKSSLLSVLTHAHPKIANYPFTTLEPNIGMLYVGKTKQIALADIPGLIEGAHSGKGLGIQFLRHVEKTRIFLHCISVENDNVLDAYQTVRKELEEYNATLLEKKEIILLTKTDLVDEKTVAAKVKELKKTKKDIIPFSLYNEKDIEYIKKILAEQ
ncbi:MAG TPA: GTPase ObgE [Patescibacteria group bacterium]|nr:GTPase ObgE [Patescibacteria group bacterium]